MDFGSVVVALAAQDLAKNIFSGATIFIDKPFIIGDWIKTSKCEGTVEDITFRTTRIRNFENLEVVVPNSELINDSIINYNRLDKRRMKIYFYLSLDTSAEMVERIVNRLKIVLENTENVITGSVYTNWEEIDEKGIEIYIYLDTDQVAYDYFMKQKTKVRLEILKTLETENLRLAYPEITINKKDE